MRLVNTVLLQRKKLLEKYIDLIVKVFEKNSETSIYWRRGDRDLCKANHERPLFNGRGRGLAVDAGDEGLEFSTFFADVINK